MKKMMKKALSVMLVVVIMLTAAPLSGFVGLELPELLDFSIVSNAAETSGTCGDNLTWTFGDSTGTLTISGTGAMKDYKSDIRPWEGYIDNIKKVVINDGVTTIGDSAFFNCHNLISVTIPDSVTTIGDSAFQYCYSLSDISLNDKLTKIGGQAFVCTNITEITIPSGVDAIGYSVFLGCKNLTNISVASANMHYSSDEYGVLFNKDKTILIQYPTGNTRNNYVVSKTVKTIESSAFFSCLSLETIMVNINNKNYSNDRYGVLFNKDQTTLIAYPAGNSRTSYIIPKSVTKITYEAFYNCVNLNNIAIPESISTIEYGQFENCTNLTTITIPKGVTKIDEYAFNNCTSLKDVYYSGTKDEWDDISIGSYNSYLEKATIHYNSTSPDNPAESDEMQDGLYVFSNNMAMSYMIGDRIFLAVSQVDNGNYSVPEKLSISFMDTAKIKLIDIFDYDYLKNSLPNPTDDIFPENFKYCKFVLLEAKKEGITDFVLTNSDTKNTFRSYIMVSEDTDASFRADKVGTRIDHGEEYNFVVNGIVISDFKCTETTGGYDFEMNAYNSKYSLGVVEVYNANGKLIQVEKIDKFAPKDDVVGVFAEGWYLIEDFFEGELLTFKQASTSKHKHIRVFVPQEGYIRVTNDSAVSTSCFILNLFDAISSSGGIISGTSSLNESQIDILDKKVLEKFIFNTFYMETAQKYQENLKNMVAENITETVILSLISQIGGIAEGLLMDIDLSFADICKEALGTAAGIGEEIFTKVTGIYGATLGAMMNSRTVINYANQMRDWVITTDKQGYYGIKTPYNSNYDSGVLTSGDGITVKTNGNVSSEVILQTVRILKDDSITTELNTSEILNDYIVYNISLVKDGEEIQPDGSVTVSLKVPLGFGDKVSVSRQREDGSWQLIKATVKNGVISFDIDHFCKFVIGDVVGSFNINQPSTTTIRHKDGIKFHANIDGTAPAGSYVVWTANNNKFKTEEINNGNSLKIVSDSNGTTTFTATLYSADGEVIATDTIEMKSKAGFFDKIGSFFRSLFGGTKIYEN